MNGYPHRRRTLSAILIVLGGLFIFFAPGNAWIGAVLAIAGVVIELIAFGLARRGDEGNQGEFLMRSSGTARRNISVRWMVF